MGKERFETVPYASRGCVAIGGAVENVMPNLFRHLTKSNSYETLNQVQGDRIVITTQPFNGRRKRDRDRF